MKLALYWILLLSILSTSLFAQDEPKERKKIGIGINYGAFYPINSTVRDNFGEVWSGISISPIYLGQPDHWKFDFDVSFFGVDSNDNAVTLVPLTIGARRAIGNQGGIEPYIYAHAGSYYGFARALSLGVDDNKFGLTANAGAGVTFNNRFYVEGRYDYFDSLNGLDFSGFSLRLGIKLFDIKY